MKKIVYLSLLLLVLLLPTSALAENYSFFVPETIVDVFWNEDGTMSLAYEWVFTNESGASAIDFVDVGMPNPNFDLGSITADIDGQEITDIETSPYVKYGVALGLGADAIPGGQTGRVRMYVPVVQQQLYQDEIDPEYASAVFAPSYFDPQFVKGETDLTVVYHLPPGVETEEPRWHTSPAGFPDQPEAAKDQEGRIVYIWRNENARATKEYIFGASFPQKYVTAGAMVQPDQPVYESSYEGESSQGIFAVIGGCLSFLPALVCFGIGGLFISTVLKGSRTRKAQYLPPVLSVEGHGIKRGLTAIEAAILLEQPVDKILTMILFSTIKKNAASVKSRDPLDLEISSPLPEGLHEYETEFLKAFAVGDKRKRRKALQDVMVSLVKGVSNKMKGFSRKETVAYYKDITERAWKQVEAAETPEVKSEKYDEVMEWTMLDGEYDDRTRRVFGPGPVFVPMWWPRYDPTFPRAAPSAPRPVSTGKVAVPSGKGGGTTLPHLPGSDFAASMVQGVQTFSAGVIGNMTDFTRGITRVTNPAPKSTTTSWKGSSGGGLSCACACACACAGCACACAGGGR